MGWEEIVFVVTNVVQVPMMWPMFKAKEKPPISSSLMLTGRALVCGVAYLSLGLGVAFLAMAAVATAWGFLAVQKARQ